MDIGVIIPDKAVEKRRAVDDKAEDDDAEDFKLIGHDRYLTLRLWAFLYAASASWVLPRSVRALPRLW